MAKEPLVSKLNNFPSRYSREQLAQEFTIKFSKKVHDSDAQFVLVGLSLPDAMLPVADYVLEVMQSIDDEWVKKVSMIIGVKCLNASEIRADVEKGNGRKSSC